MSDDRAFHDEFNSPILGPGWRRMAAEAGFGQPTPRPTNAPSAHDRVIEDMRSRKAMGLAKYGTLLQHDSGRDHLKDAYEESLDLCVYLRAALDARDGIPSETCAWEASDGERCQQPKGHKGRCYSRLATPENVAKCLHAMPDGSKCQRQMNHPMPHQGPAVEKKPLADEFYDSEPYEQYVTDINIPEDHERCETKAGPDHRCLYLRGHTGRHLAFKGV
ncbi:hypothetical protein QLT00_gp05 [Gordonia phage Commandaria]|uniref:Uncharacterized protein n=1 Tax=Gordonia phage Commandaria TaxID=3038364 RepID=A0AAF0GG71_9CAUD|nr:hypothetical protein QLT00_gp05 [Gordonia phage Commandaria]WGH20788.1 hypothetical protein [Gordonia phage Commandaria]